MKITRVNQKNKCVICGKPNWCTYTADGKLALCMRVASDKTAKNLAYIHVLDDSPRLKSVLPSKTIPTIKSVKRTADELNEIYSEFLSRCVLSFKHQKDLTERGLNQIEIFTHGYKSMPTQLFANRICRELVKQGFNLRGVPGFYKFTDWHFRTYNLNGFLIPIRDAKHKIVGLQLRSDNNQSWATGFAPKYMMVSSGNKPGGKSSGTPPHFATLGNFTLLRDVLTVTVTEGALKANVINRFTGANVVGLVGVGCFDENFPRLLKESYPNLNTVKIAFDMDWKTNENVKAQLHRLILTLENSRIETSVLSWNSSYKGLDDYLLANNSKIKLAA